MGYRGHSSTFQITSRRMSERRLPDVQLLAVKVPQFPAGDDFPKRRRPRHVESREQVLEAGLLLGSQLFDDGVIAQCRDLAADVDNALIHGVREGLARVAADDDAP